MNNYTKIIMAIGLTLFIITLYFAISKQLYFMPNEHISSTVWHSSPPTLVMFSANKKHYTTQDELNWILVSQSPVVSQYNEHNKLDIISLRSGLEFRPQRGFIYFFNGKLYKKKLTLFPLNEIYNTAQKFLSKEDQGENFINELVNHNKL